MHLEGPKTAGVLGEAWKAMNTPIPGTPTLLAGRLLKHETTEVAKKVAPAAQKTKDQIFAARRAAYKTASMQAFSEELQKLAFTASEYSTPIEGPKVARQESAMPPFRKPSLRKEAEGFDWKHALLMGGLGSLATAGGLIVGVGSAGRRQLMDELKGKSKHAFTQSQYGSTGGFVDFHQVSSQPGFRRPSLSAPVQKQGDFNDMEPAEKDKRAGVMTQTGLTPASMLSSAKRIGMPKVTAPTGPSIADISKPKGFGQKIPGATITP